MLFIILKQNCPQYFVSYLVKVSFHGSALLAAPPEVVRTCDSCGCLQLPAGGVGGPEGDVPSVHARHHEELQLPRASAGQQQRLWGLPAAVRRELPAGTATPETAQETHDCHTCVKLKIPRSNITGWQSRMSSTRVKVWRCLILNVLKEPVQVSAVT